MARKRRRKVVSTLSRSQKAKAFNQKYANEIASGQRLSMEERQKLQQMKNSGKTDRARKFKESILEQRRSVYDANNTPPVSEEVSPQINSEPVQKQSIPYIPEYKISPTDLVDSEFYNRRVNNELADINKYMAAKGLYNSGAANEVAADTIGRIRGEQAQKELDIATKLADMNFNVDASNIANYLANTQFEANRTDANKQQSFNNAKDLVNLFLSNSPLSTGYDASNKQSALENDLGNYLTRTTADRYKRVVAGGSGGALPPLPIKDTTPIDIVRNKGEQAKIISGANTTSQQVGNTLNNLGSTAQSIGNLISLFM